MFNIEVDKLCTNHLLQEYLSIKRFTRNVSQLKSVNIFLNFEPLKIEERFNDIITELNLQGFDVSYDLPEYIFNLLTFYDSKVMYNKNRKILDCKNCNE